MAEERHGHGMLCVNLKVCIFAVFVMIVFVLLSKQLQFKILPFKNISFTPLLVSGDYIYRFL